MSHPDWEHSAVVVKKGDKFVVAIPQMGILQTGTSLEEAYEKVESIRLKAIEEFQEWGIENFWQDYKVSTSFSNEIKLFLIKVAIVSSLVGVVLLFGATVIQNQIRNKTIEIVTNLDKAQPYIGGAVHHLHQHLKSLKDEPYRSRVHNFFQSMKPLVDEMNQILPGACKKTDLRKQQR